MSSLISVKQLSVSFTQAGTEKRVVEDVSFDIKKGETLALVGESGSGKSVTAHAIMKLLPYPVASHPSGKILFEGEDLLGFNEKQMRAIRGNKIGMVFQEPMTALNPLHTVEKQISEVLMLHRGLRKPQARVETLKLLQRVQIKDPERRLIAYPHELSGGQRQRVMIAMALANEPELLIADEPTTALDVTVQREIMELLAELQYELGMAMLLITHDLGIVKHFSNRVAVMQQGRLVEQADTPELFRSPKHAYSKMLLDSEPSGEPCAIPASEQPLLSSQQVSVSFALHKPLLRKPSKFFHAVKNIDLNLDKGATLGIIGESGSGKSTLAMALLRLIDARGSIRFKDTELNGLDEKSIRPYRRQLQVVFQDPFASLSPRMTVSQIIAEGLHVHSQLSEDAIEEKVIDVMREVDLEIDSRHRYPHEFSGGQRQRIAIARALILNPEVIFLDEPTSALDRAVQVQVLDLLRRLQRERQLSYIFISHDLKVIQAISHHIGVMQAGEMVEYGEAKQVIEKPQHAYTRALFSAALN